jgi:hypothetical protein
LQTYRTIKSPEAYQGHPSGRAAQLNSIYIGFVKAVDDIQYMGRLRVYIPELCSAVNDPDGWITVSYASPFAGATPWKNVTDGSDYTNSQISYGMWMIPPDLENEVLVCFVNGDPARGVWFACLFNQFMNHMVPGIPGNNSTIGTPVGEYNKLTAGGSGGSSATVTNFDLNNVTRPTYTPLASGLATQGLSGDSIRGVSDSGARRSSNMANDGIDNINGSVFGILTPQGHQFVMDDNKANQFIRLRTPNGTQILINDTNGNIYLNSVNGESWLELSANGVIDIYGGSDINIRTQGNFNLRADGDINLDAGGSINAYAHGTDSINLQTDGNFNLVVAKTIDMKATLDVKIIAEQSINLTAADAIREYADNDIIRSSLTRITDGAPSVDTSTDRFTVGHSDPSIIKLYGQLYLNNPPILDGGGQAKPPPEPDASWSSPPNSPATYPSGSGGVSQAITVTHMPTHEPYAGHATGRSTGRAESTSTAAGSAAAGSAAAGSAAAPGQAPPAPVTSQSFAPAVPGASFVPRRKLGLPAKPIPPTQVNVYPGIPQPGYNTYSLWTWEGVDTNKDPKWSLSPTSAPDGFFKTAGEFSIMSPDGIQGCTENFEGKGAGSYFGGHGDGKVYPDPGTMLPDVGYGHTLEGAEAAGWYVQIGSEKVPTDILVPKQAGDNLYPGGPNQRAVTMKWAPAPGKGSDGVVALSDKQMYDLLAQDLKNRFIPQVQQAFSGVNGPDGNPVKLTQYQFDVIIDLLYNGNTNWRLPILALAAGRGAEVPTMLVNTPYYNQGYPGLRSRRFFEANTWWVKGPP